MSTYSDGELVVFGSPSVPGWGQGGTYRVVGSPTEDSSGQSVYCLDWVSGRRTQPQTRVWVYESELTAVSFSAELRRIKGER